MMPTRAAVLLMIAGNAAAGPFSELIVFGDSLSDVGNTSAATLGVQPGPEYFDGRFSNGPVYAERLAEGLGLGPLVRSELGGGNYAYGGAETDGPGFFGGGLFLDSLVEQVDVYLNDLGPTPVDPDALHVVFIGGNDFLDGQTNPAEPAAIVQQQMSRLVDAGAQRFLGFNLPRLSLTPNDLGDSSLGALSIAFNEELERVYHTIESANPLVAISRVDVEAFLDGVVADPASLGFTDVTGRGIGVDKASGYLFWDGIHPTREAHALLGETAIRAALPVGDFDRDGFVTPADYSVWGAGVGAAFDAAAGVTTGIQADLNGDGRVDAADYTGWREASVGSPAAVPEPAGAAAAVGVVAISAAACSRRRPR